MPQVPWWRRKEMSGGQAVEQTIHVTDMARYLFGDVISVYAAGRTGLMTDVPDYNIEDSSAATLVFENGLAATIFSACFLSGGRGKGGIDIFTKDMNIEYRGAQIHHHHSKWQFRTGRSAKRLLARHGQ